MFIAEANKNIQPIAARWAAPGELFLILKRLTKYPC
jgi:hypothetical protein